MDPSADTGGNIGGALEEHLRNLGGAATQREEQALNRPTSQRPNPPHLPEPCGSGSHSQPSGPGSARKGRKRPNQAQRRQMSAQLTLPIGPAASLSPTAPFSAPYPSSDFYQARPRHSAGPYQGQQLQASFNGSQSQGWPQAPSLHGSQPLAPWVAPTSHTPPDATPSPFPPRAWHREQSYSYGRRPNHSLPALPVAWRSAGSVAHRGDGLSVQPKFPSARDGEVLARQAESLNRLCTTVLAGAEIDRADIARKEAFRVAIEALCRRVISDYEREHNGIANFSESTVQLQCFGSLSSGFATKASDMDLGLLSPMSLTQPDASGSPIPRLLEKAFLDAGLGARLLTRTRVPIIKLCEKPPAQLLNDLRKEREKWDSGIGMEDMGTVEDDSRNTQPQPVGGPEQGSTKNAVGSEEAPYSRTDVISGLHDDTDLLSRRHARSQSRSGHDGKPVHFAQISLSQAENQSLSAYYGSAKRLLRKLGGCDLTASNYRNLSGEDFELLGAVTHAFLAGLRDKALRDRLYVSPACQAQSAWSPENARSLLGIYTQAEGEAILILWERRAARERTDERERAVTGAFELWKTICNKTGSGFDWVHRTKELQVLLEKLKKFPSVQFVLLEQGQYESATAYSDRAAGLIPKLTSRYPDSGRTSESEVVERYISGVHHSDIRTSLENLSRELGEDVSFSVAVRKHKALQLAYELEKALAAGFYPGITGETVASYVELLREPMRRVISANGHREWAVPVTSGSASVLATIRHLQDPSVLAPNKPRDAYNDKLEFPKKGAGVQCDINFSAHLALQNTRLLRCYSHTDPRVRPLVLFVKYWAKVRGINTPYRGTLSSYGYVLMVLHFLVNVAKPFVCPNLQMLAPPPSGTFHAEQDGATDYCKGRDVRFWKDEQEIIRLARENSLNQNQESVGDLLRGFFEYYAHGGALLTLPGRGFDWGREVLSLRTPGGLLTKQEKGWTGAKTTTIVQGQVAESDPSGEGPKCSGPNPMSSVNACGHSSGESPGVPSQGVTTTQPTHMSQRNGETREVRHRYLLAVEDPFELDHNVARTVTHNGIVSIRDEFRRAWRIIQSAGFGREDEDLLQPVAGAEDDDDGEAFCRLLAEIHATTPQHIEAMNGNNSGL